MAFKFNRERMAQYREQRDSLSADYARINALWLAERGTAKVQRDAVPAEMRHLVDVSEPDLAAAFTSLATGGNPMGETVGREVKAARGDHPIPVPTDRLDLVGDRSAIDRARTAKAKADRRQAALSLVNRRVKVWNAFMAEAEKLAEQHGDAGIRYEPA